ncbi:hypothetical protein NM2000080_2151 [Neisseria meningitidis 2000080]|nr:hypothetical protein NM2000080_2151 [Neisseria meningitidis 2000080]
MRVRTGLPSEKLPTVSATCSCPFASSKPCIVNTPHSVGRRQDATWFNISDIFTPIFSGRHTQQQFQRFGQSQGKSHPFHLCCRTRTLCAFKFHMNHAQHTATFRADRNGNLRRRSMIAFSRKLPQIQPTAYIRGNIHPTALRRTASQRNLACRFIQIPQVFQNLALSGQAYQLESLVFRWHQGINRRTPHVCRA